MCFSNVINIFYIVKFVSIYNIYIFAKTTLTSNYMQKRVIFIVFVVIILFIATMNFLEFQTEQGTRFVPVLSEKKLDFSAEFASCHADGTTDDSDELQRIINNASGVVNFPCHEFYLSKSLDVDLSKIHRINGNGATLIIDGDYPAMEIAGTMKGSADPTTLTDDEIKNQAGFVVNGFKIYSKTKTKGTGIYVHNALKPTIENCYLFNLSNGIVFANRNRDLIIANNQIYNIHNSGIVFESTCNIHQMNILGNHISYCRYCINYDNTTQIANVQISGNDIEIAMFPNDSFSEQRCLRFVNGGTFMNEIVISGNTIQGHSLSNGLIDIEGTSDYRAQYITISGNHISNAITYAIKLKNAHTATLCGNSYAEPGLGVLTIQGNCDTVTLTGESVKGSCIFVEGNNSTSLKNLLISSCVGTNTKAFSYFENCVSLESVRFCNNVIDASQECKIQARNIDYIAVKGNSINGVKSFNISECEHKDISDNM